MNRPEDPPMIPPLLSGRSIFTAMLQDGPFAIGDEPPLARPFSRNCKRWVRTLGRDQLRRTKYRAIRNQIFDFLGIDSFEKIPALIHNQEERARARTRSRQLLANMFGLTGSDRIIRYHIHDYAAIADEVIDTLCNKVMGPYSAHIEMTNEIRILTEPLDLLLTLFDDRYHRKARFEAKRKLVLMNLAGSIDQRERETDIETQFAGFIDFLNRYVWSPDLKIGDLEISYLHSFHRPDDFGCQSVRVISARERAALRPGPGEKLTLIKRRRFNEGGREVPVYVTIRKKPPAAKVLKLLRKNEKNPAAAVDDELGLMAVLNSVGDVKRFLRHLTGSAIRANSFMTLEDISDTLTGGHYLSSATGSSGKTPMLKFFARLGGMRVEFIIHTNRSYLNYIYQREVAHDEYEVKRIFDTGVAAFLFPPDIYHLDLDEIRTSQVKLFRKIIEEA